ncbi:MAG TPA: hemerythrin family protein [Steroidobacteraceae bacterium]|nr:hemerythrin family protein [Steroidobacteraceae bacterium]
MPAAPAGPTPSPVPWSEDFACGEMLIDEQHRTLFTHVNQMLAAFDAGEAAQALEHLDELVMHTIEHFRYEEEMLTRSGYADLREHQRDHMMLLERTLTFRNDVAKGVTPLWELLQFLVSEVVVKHLIETDRQYFGDLARWTSATGTVAGR